MKARCFLFGLLLAGAGASAGAPGIALAQGSDGDKATARQLTIDGIAALQRRDYAGAASLFDRADALYHAPTVTLGRARAQAGLNRLLAAQELYQRLVHEPLPPNPSEAFVRAIDDARAELAALSPRIPSLIVQARGAVPARVILDGVEVPAAALGIKRPVDPGRHTIRAVARGFTPTLAAANVAEGSTETVTLDFAPVGLGMSDGVDELEAGGSGGSTLRTVGFAALGVGAAGLVVGAITLGLDGAKHSNLIAKCPTATCPPSLAGDVSTYHTLGAVSTSSLIAGGALAAAGAILVLTAPKAQARVGSLAPLIGPGFVGVRGRFQ